MAKTLLDGKRGTMWDVYPEDMCVIGVDTNHTSLEDHPAFDERVLLPLSEPMVANIGTVGVLEPLLVDKALIPVDRIVNERFKADAQGVTHAELAIVIDGRRRCLHAREVNRQRVATGLPPIQIPVFAGSVRRGGSTAPNWLSVSSSANEFRVDDTVLGRAKKAAAMRASGVSLDAIGLNFGVGASQIEQWLTLAHASEEIRDSVQRGVVSAMTAISIASRPPAMQRRLLSEAVTAAEGGKRLTKTAAKKAAGEKVPPSRKEIKAELVRLESLAERGESSADHQLWSKALRWALYGEGDLPPIAPPTATKPVKPKVTKPKADPKPDDRQSEVDALAAEILSFGLTDKAAVVYDPQGEVESVAKRMEAAGFPADPKTLSAACTLLVKRGDAVKTVKGIKRAQPERV